LLCALAMADNLKSSDFFSGFDAAERETLAKIARRKRFTAGQPIFRQGEKADGFYVIENGLISLDYALPHNRKIQLQQLSSGEVLGWSWLTEPCKWKFGATAVDNTTTSFFSAVDVRNQCERNPKLGYVLMERIALALMERLQATRHKLLVYTQRASGEDAQIC
jgi:CRP/FNR family transcriptional regulator, cyclic AMP receptor protein